MPNANALRTEAAKMTSALPYLEKIGEEVDPRLAEIEVERRALTGPLPRAEVAERTRAWLRRTRSEFERERASGYDMTATAFDVVFAVSEGKAPWIKDPNHAFVVLCWLLGPVLEQGVGEAVGRLDYHEGPPAEERHRRGADLDAERDRLVRARRELVERASAAGVDVRHLPETEQEIGREQAQAQNEAVALRRQQEAAKAIDSRHEGERRSRLVNLDARPTQARSAYLAGGGVSSERAEIENATRERQG